MPKGILFCVLLVAVLSSCGRGTPTPAAAPPAGPAPAVLEKGEHVYKLTCALCHAAGVGGAPKIGDAADWGPRIGQGKDTLYTHALNGFTGSKGAMPAKGANPALADEDVKAAVDYMTAQVK
jgi:cytochrome c5